MSNGQLALLGVNLAGADFGSAGQAYGVGYTYPSDAEIDYEAARGMNVIRLPFLWERLQPTLGGPLDPAELGRIQAVVDRATADGLKVVLDVHNFGQYRGQLVGSAAVPDSAFADLWGRIAGQFAGNPNVIFGLMNEPQQPSAAGWLQSVNTAIAAIRSAGAAQEVLVSGIGWDGAWTWTTGANASTVGAGVRDPLGNYAFDVHQYLDSDGSGTHANVVSGTIGSQRLQAITAWAEQTGNRLFLGEFGVASDSTSLSALGDMLSYMGQHANVWQGGTYWAAGPWWGNYMYSAEPQNGVDAPQMTVLESFAHHAAAAPQVPGTGPVATPASATGAGGSDTSGVRPTSPQPQTGVATPSPAGPTPFVLGSTPRFRGNGLFVITGTAAPSAAGDHVDITASVGGVPTALGSAQIGTDGTFAFMDHVGAQGQTGLSATLVDGTGTTETAPALFDLAAGIGGEPYRASVDRYDAGGAPIGSSYFRGDGRLLYRSTVVSEADGGTEVTYAGGIDFAGKSVSDLTDRYAPDGTLIAAVETGRDGSHRIDVLATGQAIGAIGNDTFDATGQPSTTFVFAPGFGQDVINGFVKSGEGHDTLSLASADYTGLGQVLRETQQTAAGAVVHDSATGDSILLAGVTKADLLAHAQRDITFHP